MDVFMGLAIESTRLKQFIGQAQAKFYLAAGRLSLSKPYLARVAWALLLLALPVTSIPFFPPAIGGEALVRPLSLYPLGVLLFIAVLPRLFSRPLSRSLLSLLPFVLIATASSLLSLLRGIEPALGISASARVLRGLFTLAIGCAFYLTMALLPETIEDLRFSLRWIYAGVALAMGWGTFQALGLILSNPGYTRFLENAQAYISIRRLNPERIVGMTYEPHWFAEQIILLLVPWALAAVLNGYTVFYRRWRWLTVEWLLLGWALVILPFTYSRAGLLNLIIVVLVSVLLFAPIGKVGALRNVRRATFQRLALISLTIAIVITPIYLIGTRSLFFARIWDYWSKPGASLDGYFDNLGFGARLIYSQAAFRMYQAYPIVGVGLGNYAFYFEEMLPYRPIADVPEALAMITPEYGRDRLITAKNLYLRLLAETGITGFIAFIAFLVANLGSALVLWRSRQPEWRYWGTASLCGLIAITLSALTFDSFVIPNMWVFLGLITAAARCYGDWAPAPRSANMQ